MDDATSSLISRNALEEAILRPILPAENRDELLLDQISCFSNAIRSLVQHGMNATGQSNLGRIRHGKYGKFFGLRRKDPVWLKPRYEVVMTGCENQALQFFVVYVVAHSDGKRL